MENVVDHRRDRPPSIDFRIYIYMSIYSSFAMAGSVRRRNAQRSKFRATAVLSLRVVTYDYDVAFLHEFFFPAVECL